MVTTALPVIEERFNLAVTDQQHAHLIRLYCPGEHRGAIFMMHGLMQDAQCFYEAASRTGLACVLARAGYDVYLGELRGRRLEGRILKRQGFTLDQAINNDMKRLVTAMQKRAAGLPQIWIGQGLGSLLQVCFLARNPTALSPLAGMVHFSPFRRLIVESRRKHWWFAGLYAGLLKRVSRLLGYVPGQLLGQGYSNESLPLLKGLLAWQAGEWCAEDGFSYAQAVADIDWPPALYFASLYPSWRVSEADARAFMFDLGDHNGRLVKLGQSAGNQKNYKSDRLCLDQDAEGDYYPLMLQWIEQQLAQAQIQAGVANDSTLSQASND